MVLDAVVGVGVMVMEEVILDSEISAAVVVAVAVAAATAAARGDPFRVRSSIDTSTDPHSISDASPTDGRDDDGTFLNLEKP